MVASGQILGAGTTAALADLVCSVDATALSDRTRRMIHGAILGVLGTGVAGTQSIAAAPLIQYIAGAGCSSGALVWGRSVRTWAPLAALANGTAAHLFDWDDTSESAQAHLTVTILPAILALGETMEIPGQRVLDAYVAGYELAALLGRAVNPMLVERGWHATGVLGTFAATAACCRILALDQGSVVKALSVAASMASALMVNLGTDTKALHAGLAARNGVDAAMLAQQGFSGSPDVFAGKLSPLAVFAGVAEDRLHLVRQERGTLLDVEAIGLIMKAYPCCASAHRSVEASLHLTQFHNLQWNLIDGVRCRVSALAYHKLHHTPPRSPLEAKLHVPYCIAAAIEDGGLYETSFSELRLKDTRYLGLMDRIQVEIHPDQTGRVPPSVEFSEVIMSLRDGGTVSHRVLRPRGTPERPLEPELVRNKFRVCAEPVLGPQRAAACIEAVESLEKLTHVSDLARLLEPAA